MVDEWNIAISETIGFFNFYFNANRLSPSSSHEQIAAPVGVSHNKDKDHDRTSPL
jgi:hypothetical protein